MIPSIVSEATINGFVTTIETDGDVKPPAQIALARLPNPYDLIVLSDVQRLAYDCFKLNVLAIDSLYGDGASANLWQLSFTPRRNFVSREQAYKSITFFLLQCIESHVAKTPLFKALQCIKADIGDAIVRNLPSYENATWG